ncbi:sensor domain-containing diguanylate cyclase [Shewanella sp. WXL01]|uniref:GGDEF domain-containing protein n=1 Tax=Shewanella sp. WXL01 TaxID=2709721 RepID=UPI0014385915|nr:sensor domain-containing diguanylate cyclase [Shewanella sp. WXL01]NKF49559.1 sensor domain-containing diguanylate cyclase [Shewanella sp. WXL01]
MLAAPIPENEQDRVETLRSLNVLDTAAEERFDRITRLAQRLFNVEICLVSLVDSERQWFKSAKGLDACETSRDISFCGHAIVQEHVFTVEDASIDPRFSDNPLVQQAPFIRFYAGYPLKMPNGVRVGTLCIIDSTARQFSDEDKLALEDLGKLVEDELISVQRSTLDVLTGLSNRCGFEMLAEQTLASCDRYQVGTSLLFFDLDYFKDINDQYGHEQGDVALQAFAEVLKANFRESDVVARFGGDEFVVLISHMNCDEIEIILSRFEHKLAEQNKLLNKPYDIAYSVGVCQRQHNSELDLAGYLAKADEAMFKVKAQHHQGD